MDNNNEILGIDLVMIQNSPKTWSINKSLAFKLSFNSFQTVGQFFKDLSNDDLRFLLEKVELLGHEELPDQQEAEELYTEFMLLACLLAHGEGSEIVDDAEEVSRMTNVLCVLITTESLCRKGLVEVKYENMSLSDTESDRELARLTDAGREMFKDLKDGGFDI